MKTKYVCDVCNSQYDTEELAKKCENKCSMSVSSIETVLKLYIEDYRYEEYIREIKLGKVELDVELNATEAYSDDNLKSWFKERYLKNGIIPKPDGCDEDASLEIKLSQLIMSLKNKDNKVLKTVKFSIDVERVINYKVSFKEKK